VTQMPVGRGLGPQLGASTVATALHAPELPEPIATAHAADIAAGIRPGSPTLSAPPTSAGDARGTSTPLTGRADGCPPAARPAVAPAASPLVLDDDALEAEVLAAVARSFAPPTSSTAQRSTAPTRHLPVAAPPPPPAHAAATAQFAAGRAVTPVRASGSPAVRPRIRARHRPVMRDVPVPTPQAG
jgi:hypothetical protein